MMGQAPGCFGSPVARSLGRPVCENCTFAVACDAEAMSVAEKLREELDVSDVLDAITHAIDSRGARVASRPRASKPVVAHESPSVSDKPKKQSPKPAVDGKLAELPKKAAELVQSLARAGIEAEDICAMCRGDRDVSVPRPFVTVAITALRNGAMSRRDLSDTFTRELGWGRSTSDSHVSIIQSALIHYGAAEKTPKGIRIIA